MAVPVPTVRPFRALRYDPAVVGDLAAVICPPYDVISAADRERFLARHPRNAVRIELPVQAERGEGRRARAAGEESYRRAAKTLRAWRRQGALRRDERPSLYVYEQRYRLPGEAAERTQRGFFASLRLEPLGAGIRPHERTMSAPKEDRLRLLRATATNTSAIVLLSADRTGRTGEALAYSAAGPPTAEATDDVGIRHRLWTVATEEGMGAEQGRGVEGKGADGKTAAALVAGAQAHPLTIADGHHRYETALRYRDERRAAAGRGERAGLAGEQPFDYVLVLVLNVDTDETAGEPTVLPTHRLVTGDIGDSAGARGLAARADGYFTVTPRAAGELVRSFSPPFRAGGSGRLGLLAGGRAYELVARREAIEPLFGSEVPAAVRHLDVAVLEAVLRLVLPDAVVGRLAYTHAGEEARRAVESGEAAAAFLLEPTPVSDVVAVAAAGALMPQKSTFFYPKVATGLVMRPLE